MMAENHMFKILLKNFVDVGGFEPILGITRIACALICLRKGGSSFFYHTEAMSCVPSLVRHFDTAILNPHNGYQYYVPYCDEDWELFNGTCYYFEYKTLNYEQAQTNCLEKGGYLAKTDDDAENALFVTLSQRGSFWIGGKKENDTWIWLDGTPIPSEYWAVGEPTGSRSCIQQWKSKKGLDDIGCTKSKCSLCEKGHT